MKILKFLFIFALALFPFGELLRFDMGNNVVLKPLDVLVGLSALLLLIITFIKNKKITPKWELFLFPLIGLLSLFINISWLKPYEFIVSLLYLIRWVAYASLFLLIIKFDAPFKKKIEQFLFIDGLIIIFLGYLQYFIFPSLKSLYSLGWDEHMVRLFSVFFDPNYAGAFFVLYFLFIGDKLYKTHKNKRLRLVFILILTLFAIFLTFSRSALLMLIFGTFIYLIIIKRKKLILIILGAVILFALIFSSKFNIENMNLFREASGIARLANYSTAIKIITDRPLLGVGFNSYRYAKEMYGIRMGWVKAPSHADAGVDNSFLFVLATTGLIGFLAYLYLWISLLKKASPLVISSAFALLINAFFINSLFFAPLMLWMWLILALL